MSKDELTELEKNFGKISEKQKLGICMSFLESCDKYEEANRSLRETLLDYYKSIDRTLKMLEEKNREIDQFEHQLNQLVEMGSKDKIQIHCWKCGFVFSPKFKFKGSVLFASCPKCKAEVFE